MAEPGRDVGTQSQKLALLALSSVAVALVLFISHAPGVPALAQQETRGAITGLTLASDYPGELLITWDEPDPEPSDYRISWTPAGEKFIAWDAPNEDDRGNAYEDGDLLSFTVIDLPSGAGYQVRVRARYNAGVYATEPWSGPWVYATTTLARAGQPTPGPTPEAATDPEARDAVNPRSFTARVNGDAPPSNNATLSNLEVEGAVLFRSFLYDLLDYTAMAAHDTATSTITAMAAESGATIDYVPGDADVDTGGYQRTLVTGDNLVTITVTAPDGVTTQSYTVTINRAAPPSTDATLKRLAIAGATTSPGFQSSVKSYSTTVRARMSVVTVELEPSDDGATIETSPSDFNPDAEGWQIPVEVGTTTTGTILVTAEDGVTTDTYTLTISRNSPEMELAPLISLAVEGVSVFPEFEQNVLAYTAFVDHDRERVTVTATARDQGATVSVNPADRNATTTGYQLDLEQGRNTIVITVTAMDGTTTREYELTVFRTPEAADTRGFLQVDAGYGGWCGVRVDHTLACGPPGYTPTPTGAFERVSVKRFLRCALRSDGSQQCWINDDRRRTGVKVGGFDLSAEYGAELCALMEDGDIECQLYAGRGRSSNDPKYRVYEVEGPFKAIAHHRRGICAIRSDDKVRCWGYMSGGRPHRISFIPIDMPEQYRDTEFKFISGGYGNACGIRKSDAAALCWYWYIDYSVGFNENRGQTITSTPDGEYTFVDAASGTGCGVRTDGTVDCWNSSGKIINSISSPPGETDIGYRSVTLDSGSICGLRNDGQMRCWSSHSGNLDTKIRLNSGYRSNSRIHVLEVDGVRLSLNGFSYSATVGNHVKAVAVKPRAHQHTGHPLHLLRHRWGRRRRWRGGPGRRRQRNSHTRHLRRPHQHQHLHGNRNQGGH